VAKDMEMTTSTVAIERDAKVPVIQSLVYHFIMHQSVSHSTKIFMAIPTEHGQG